MGREIVYCGDCGRRLSEDEFDRGRAHFVENRPYCADCRPLKTPSFAAKKKHSTTHIPLPPLTPRRAMAASGSVPPARPPSRAPLLIGAVVGAVALVALVVALATGGKGGSSAGPVEVRKPVADDLLPSIQALEKFAASGAEPEAVLTRCDRDRPLLASSKYRERFAKVDNAAREKKAAHDKAAQFEFMLKDIRTTIAGDPDFDRRDAILDRLARAKGMAGPKLPAVETILADYNVAYAAFQRREAAAKPIVLSAEAGTRKGTKLQLKGDYLGNWSTVGDSVEWTFEAARAGPYRVELAYACDKDAGGEYTVTSGAAQLKAAIEPTGDWKKYKTVPLGTLVLSQGRVTVSVKPLSVKGDGLMNLRTLTLTPAP